ncbi:unnamed protein product [Dibothriocephalus latus]|uniref:Uncharacterized protein n=1 Tax=Dibothriocephalus latus TaxID=60516 RepID=A0A3P7P6J2_DIBLA|nr:unnamed protein product [Dibothriocephalus latus]
MFPESWAGKRSDELDQAFGISGCLFVHNDGFMATHKTPDGALKMAEFALKAAGYL